MASEQPHVRGKGKDDRYSLFFWFVIGTCTLILMLLFVTTRASLERQGQFLTRLLTEKGEALIKAYEAGARAVAVKHWGSFEMQKLIIELSEQRGVDYLMIVDEKGLIVADSEPFRIGGYYAQNLGSDITSRATKTRRVKNASGADTFEVYRRLDLTPLRVPLPSRSLTMIVGLDMGPLLAIHDEDVKRTLYLALVLFLVGATGIMALFLAYRYRSTRSSLQALEHLSHYLLEHLPVGVVVATNEGHMRMINRTALDLLQIPDRPIPETPLSEILPPPFLMTPSSSAGQSDGEVKWNARSYEVITRRLEDGSFIILIRDLTEINTLREELERNRRLAAVGTLAAGIAHEIRNPLSSIKGFATYFHEKYRDHTPDQEAARIMITEIDRLDRVIVQLLSLTRPLVLRYEQVDLDRLFTDLRRMIYPSFAEKGVQWNHELHGLTADCDPDQMKQVFLNLLLNALAATEKGDQVSISGEVSPDGGVTVTISDSGQGIKSDDLPHVFDPFFTTKPTGTGLGLAIAHRIVTAHGGEMGITSTPGEGTQVRIVLPRHDQEEERR